MRKIMIVLCLFIALITSASAQDFEGTFVMHIQDDNSVSMMNVWVKKDQLMLQPIDPSIPSTIKVLLNKSSNDIFVLTEQGSMKMAMKYRLDNLPTTSSDQASKKTITTKETGNTKTIEGFLCKEIMVDDGEGQKLQLWVTSELGFTMAQFSDYLGKFSAGLNGGDYSESVKFNSLDAYKKSMALEIKEVKESDPTVILIKKIERKTLSENDFSTDGYMVMDVKDFGGFGGK